MDLTSELPAPSYQLFWLPEEWGGAVGFLQKNLLDTRHKTQAQDNVLIELEQNNSFCVRMNLKS